MLLKEFSQQKQQVKIWCDLDGCLCAFDAGVKKLTGKLPSELAKKDMWKAIYSIPDFFSTLDWEPDGKALWNAIKTYHPTILTGLPASRNGKMQKEEWCKIHLGENVPVIVCPSKDKHLYAKDGFILIDDRNDNVEAWKHAGGIGILHRTTKHTLDELEDILNK
jgi:hypothetical protein